jgi:hypothetical protein
MSKHTEKLLALAPELTAILKCEGGEGLIHFLAGLARADRMRWEFMCNREIGWLDQARLDIFAKEEGCAYAGQEEFDAWIKEHGHAYAGQVEEREKDGAGVVLELDDYRARRHHEDGPLPPVSA